MSTIIKPYFPLEKVNSTMLETILSFLSIKNTVAKAPEITIDPLEIESSYSRIDDNIINIPKRIELFTPVVTLLELKENIVKFTIDTFINVGINEITNLVSVHYDYELNATSLPSLMIYLTFDKEKIGRSSNIISHKQFLFTFEQKSDEGIDFSNFDTIQAFLIEDDPRTSRGTVTTVTQPTG
ncbi:MAG: hypothetical protein AAF611_00195 [Bacteroidota bacterium]